MMPQSMKPLYIMTVISIGEHCPLQGFPEIWRINHLKLYLGI